MNELLFYTALVEFVVILFLLFKIFHVRNESLRVEMVKEVLEQLVEYEKYNTEGIDFLIERTDVEEPTRFSTFSR